MTTRGVVVTGSFDDMRSRHIRFLEEAAQLGQVRVLVWDDEAVRAAGGQARGFGSWAARPRRQRSGTKTT